MNKDTQKKFEGLLDIDKTRLDDEAEDQPKKVWIYGKMLAKAIRAWDDAIAKFRLAEADADAAVRDHPSKFGLDKLTEMAVKRTILRDKGYQAAGEAVNLAKYRVGILEAAAKALDHRRTSLSMLDGQDTRNYFSRPTQTTKTDTGKSIHRRALRRKE